MTKIAKFQYALARTWHYCLNYWRVGWWHKIVITIIAITIICVGFVYGVATWYKSTVSSQPRINGVSFIPDYASYLGLNPQKTMTALENIGVKNFRLVSYWSDIEPVQGQYDFSQLDWEFKSAEAHHAKISLAIGLRQPRWPECHAPSWVDTGRPTSQWLPQLETFMTKVINHYKNSPALASYQLENEYFNNFGGCLNYSRSRLVNEYQLVKRLDPKHPIIMSRSTNFPSMPTGQPRPDEFGISVYRRVWSPPIDRYFEYPYPPDYYAFLAGATKILTGRDSIIHELQAEPWPPDGKSMLDTSLSEQDQTFNAQIFRQRIQFAKQIGIPTVYYWGASYWYYRWQIEHDKSVWNVARQLFSQSKSGQ